MSMYDELDNFFGFVEGFEDEELQRRIFDRKLYTPEVPRVQHCTCPHCGKDVFIRAGESGLFELLEFYDPENDGHDSSYCTDVVQHECDEGNLFDELPPF